jgi:acyl-CoA synthetase (AMP-forming)/AMP-acid ligase II
LANRCNNFLDETHFVPAGDPMSRERVTLLSAIEAGEDRLAASMSDGTLTYRQLRHAILGLASELVSEQPLAIWATAEMATVVGVFAALATGTVIVPLNPESGERELAHVLNDARPRAIIAAPGTELPEILGPLRQISVDLDLAETRQGQWPEDPPATAPALIMYTSGTTGPPKGVVLSASAIRANLDAVAEVWAWTENDHLVHSLPLFHVHGLVLGLIGPAFVGGSVRHLGSFSVDGITEALDSGGTMLFAVPTMYHRLANALGDNAELASALARARLLVSGSGPLMKSDYQQIQILCGQQIVERYGMTETLFITSTMPEAPRPGYVGLPLPGVDVRVVNDSLMDVPLDDTTIGSVLVRSASLFDGYLNQSEATRDAVNEGWFSTGDLGVLAPDGSLRLVGRRSTDLVKSGGYRIGTGEIEQVLIEYQGVDEVAVAGVPDADLGQRLVAWIVPANGVKLAPDDIIDYVARTLTPHKRPREIRFVTRLPRNHMGKVQKRLLLDDTE